MEDYNIKANIHSGGFKLTLPDYKLVSSSEWHYKIVNFYQGKSDFGKINIPIEYGICDLNNEIKIHYEQKNERLIEKMSYWQNTCNIIFKGNYSQLIRGEREALMATNQITNNKWFCSSINLMTTNSIRHGKPRQFVIYFLQPNGEIYEYDFTSLVERWSMHDYIFSISTILPIIKFARNMLFVLSKYETIEEFLNSENQEEIKLILPMAD